MDALLHVENLRVSYHTYAGEVQAVRNISFDVGRHEVAAIVGESGCGKSVTARSVMRLVQPPYGVIHPESVLSFDGRDVLSFDDKRLRAFRGGECSMIFQDPMTALNPTMRVGAQITETLREHKNMTREEARLEAVRLLDLVGVDEAARRFRQYPHELSGGMRQRVMIAIAFACRPRLIIADEPTTALDVTIQRRVVSLLRRLHEESASSVILITHDLGVVAGIADRVYVMYAGVIVESGAADELFYHAAHPYTASLLASVPRMTMKNKQPLPYICGAPPDLLQPITGCPFAPRCGRCMNICLDEAPAETALSSRHRLSCWLTGADGGI